MKEKSKELAKIEADPRQDSTPKEYRKLIVSLSKQGAFFKNHVSVGNCSNCPVGAECTFHNFTDESCRLAAVAVEQFKTVLAHSRHINPTLDIPGLRALASLHAAIAFCEEYFRIHGSMITNKWGRRFYSSIFKDYLRMTGMYQEQLGIYGLTPRGRVAFEKKPLEDLEKSPFVDYIKHKKKKDEHEPKIIDNPSDDE